MTHIILWSSMMIAGFGLASFSLFFVRSRKEREPWLGAGSWFTLLTVLHLLYLSLFFFAMMYIGYSPDEFSRRFPLLGIAGMGIADVRVWAFFVFVQLGLALRPRTSTRRIFLAVVAVLWAVQASFYVARMAGADRVAAALWPFHQWSETAIALGYAVSIWALAVWKGIQARRSRRVIRFASLLNLCAAPIFVATFVFYIRSGDYIFNYLAFCVLSAIWFAGSFALNMTAVEEYRFTVPRSIPDAMRREFDLSAREAEVVDGLLEGRRPAGIAEALFISVKTVNTHIQSVYRKCGVSGRPALIELTRKFAPTEAPRPRG